MKIALNLIDISVIIGYLINAPDNVCLFLGIELAPDITETARLRIYTGYIYASSRYIGSD